MKKPLRARTPLQRIMRITLLQTILIGLTLTLGYAHDARTQGLLDRAVSAKADNLQLRKVLSRIESEVDVKFVYSSTVIQPDRRVSVQAEKRKLAEVLAQVLEPLDISYRVIGGQIMLTRLGAEASSFIPNVEVKSIADQVVAGTVTGEDGGTLPGVNVLVKGTQRGTTTNREGSYRLEVPDETATLIFSFVGYEPQEMVVGNRTTINVKLVPDLKALDEVVVVGYGTQKKSDVTGSVASVDGDELAKKSTVNATQALQGLVSGVSVVNTSGSPGEGASIVIRGQGSYGSVDPLFIVDGAITDNINFIDPNDIASMEILKDASAAAIYGSRAANGVVIVTTKRGKSGKTRISFNSNYGVQSITKGIDFATSQQWRDKEVWKYNNEGLPIPPKLQEGKFDPTISTDWVDVLFRKAIQQSYNLSLSGGGQNNNNNFNFSLGYTNQERILVKSGFERINLRLNSDYDAGRFKFGESLSLNRSSFPGGTIRTGFTGYPAPVIEVQDAAGNYQAIGEGFGLDPAGNINFANPLAYITYSAERVPTSTSLRTYTVR